MSRYRPESNSTRPSSCEMKQAKGSSLPNIILAAISILLCVVALEIALRAYPVLGFQLADPGFYGSQNWFEFHPDLGYTLRRNYSGIYTYLSDDGRPKKVQIVTNPMGIRDTIPQTLGDRPLCAFLGDSFTEGYHVEGTQAYPGLVKTALAGRMYAVNFGVHNYGCEDYYKMAVFVKNRYHPDHLYIGLFVGNDIASYRHHPANAVDGYLSASFYSYSWAKIAIRSSLRPVDSANSKYPTGSSDRLRDFYDDYSDLKSCDRDSIRRYVEKYLLFRAQPAVKRLYDEPKEITELVKSTARVLKRIKDELSECDLHILIFPERVQVMDAEWEWLSGHFPEYRNRRLILDLLVAELDREGISYINCLPILDEKCYLRFDGHFSEKGHERVAEAVIRQLTEHLP